MDGRGLEFWIYMRKKRINGRHVKREKDGYGYLRLRLRLSSQLAGFICSHFLSLNEC